MNNSNVKVYSFDDVVELEQNAYRRGFSDGFSRAETTYFSKTEKDKEDTYACGYSAGRTEAINECIKLASNENLCRALGQLKEDNNAI